MSKTGLIAGSIPATSTIFEKEDIMFLIILKLIFVVILAYLGAWFIKKLDS
jgi:uncharacterized membrane protein